MEVAEKIFVLSPARTTGKRAAMILNPSSAAPLARQLRSPSGATLGEVFSFCSSLYFRGKATYAERFGMPPDGLEKAYVVTSANGLVPSSCRVTVATLERFAAVPIDASDDRYRGPLVESAQELQSRLPARAKVILLGSVATGKYVEPLAECFGGRLLFPSAFVGRGDMSRGGLLLRAAASSIELDYEPLSTTAVRKGKRPPRLGLR